MRILYILNSFGIGGVEIQLLRTLTLLSQHKWEHLVLALRPPTTLQKEFERYGFQAQLLIEQRLPFPTQIVVGVSKLVRIIKSTHPVIIHTALFPANIIARIAGRLTRTPVVEHLVNILYDPLWLLEPQYNPLKMTTQWRLDKTTVRWVSHFMALSEAVKLSAQQRLGIDGQKVSVVPYGILPEDWKPPQDRNRDDLLVVTTGRLVAQKGHKYLIMAMTKVIEKFPECRTVIIGDGPLRNELEELLNLKRLRENVLLLGRLFSQEVRSYLWQASVFAFPSLCEGQGVALLEAMASELPSVASDIPAVREIVGGEDVAILLKPMDSEAIANAICELLSFPEKRELMGKRAQEIVHERFDLRKLALKWLEVYEKVLQYGS